MTKTRQHAEKKCRKILRLDSNFSPTVQMWYNRIHAYLQLIRLKEGKAHNSRNIICFAKRKHIETPKALTLEELRDGLQFARIRKSELRKQAKGLCKVHLQNLLIDAQNKQDATRFNKIKQKIHRKENKRMWQLIQRTTANPHSPSVLRVQRVVDGETREYTDQDEVKNGIQCKCEIRFSLAHSAPIMNSLF